jgi:hypothetical protein
VRRLLVTANVLPYSLILITLMMEELSSSEAPVLARATRRNIPGNGILNSRVVLFQAFRLSVNWPIKIISLDTLSGVVLSA